MQQSIKQAHPAKDIWALACVISEAAVWTVFGQKGLIDYHRRRVEATNNVPTLTNTGYSGCFHDTTKVLDVVDEMHTEVIHGRRAHIDSIVISVLLTVGGMMVQDPTKRPDAWKVYEDLTRAVKQATPRPLASERTSDPYSPHTYSRHSMPVTSPPSHVAGLGLDINGLSLQPRSDTHGRQPYHSPSRRSTVNGRPSPLQLSGASSTGKGKSPRHDPYSPAPGTTHGPQWTPLAPIPSSVVQPSTPVGPAARPSASVTRVLNYITRKKLDRNTILRGEEWLNKLHGRDQVC